MTLLSALRSFCQLAAILALICFLPGCGKKKGKGVSVPDSSSSSAGNSSETCTSKAACPKEDLFVSGSGNVSDQVIIGYIGEEINWTFSGTTSSYTSDRTIGVIVSNAPSDADVDQDSKSGLPEEVVVSGWKPKRKSKSDKKMKVTLRDVTRCKIMEKDKEKCDDAAFLKTYDQEFSYDWKVTKRLDPSDASDDGSVNVASEDCGPEATTDGQILQKGVGTAIGVLTGGGAGILTGIIGAVASGNNNANQEPQPCQ
jgi:hypothetical protein